MPVAVTAGVAGLVAIIVAVCCCQRFFCATLCSKRKREEPQLADADAGAKYSKKSRRVSAVSGGSQPLASPADSPVGTLNPARNFQPPPGHRPSGPALPAANQFRSAFAQRLVRNIRNVGAVSPQPRRVSWETSSPAVGVGGDAQREHADVPQQPGRTLVQNLRRSRATLRAPEITDGDRVPALNASVGGDGASRKPHMLDAQWELCYDTKRGRFYYHQHNVSNGSGRSKTRGKSAWKLPAHLKPPSPAVLDAVRNGFLVSAAKRRAEGSRRVPAPAPAPASVTAAASASKPPAALSDRIGDYKVCFDARRGKFYFFHVSTKKSIWKLPAGVPPPSAALKAQVQQRSVARAAAKGGAAGAAVVTDNHVTTALSAAAATARKQLAQNHSTPSAREDGSRPGVVVGTHSTPRQDGATTPQRPSGNVVAAVSPGVASPASPRDVELGPSRPTTPSQSESNHPGGRSSSPHAASRAMFVPTSVRGLVRRASAALRAPSQSPGATQEPPQQRLRPPAIDTSDAGARRKLHSWRLAQARDSAASVAAHSPRHSKQFAPTTVRGASLPGTAADVDRFAAMESGVSAPGVGRGAPATQSAAARRTALSPLFTSSPFVAAGAPSAAAAAPATGTRQSQSPSPLGTTRRHDSTDEFGSPRRRPPLSSLRTSGTVADGAEWAFGSPKTTRSPGTPP